MERRKEGHADLSGSVGDGATAAAREPHGNLSGSEVMVAEGNISARAEPADRDGRFKLEDEERRVSATVLTRFASQAFGEHGIARPIDPPGQPRGEGPQRAMRRHGGIGRHSTATVVFKLWSGTGLIIGLS
jgi:hypothetical protein